MPRGDAESGLVDLDAVEVVEGGDLVAAFVGGAEDEAVAPRLAVEEVATAPAFERIVARAALQRVVAVAAGERVVEAVARQRVRANASAEPSIET